VCQECTQHVHNLLVLCQVNCIVVVGATSSEGFRIEFVVLDYVFCHLGKDFQLILTVKMETEHPVGGPYSREFSAFVIVASL